MFHFIKEVINFLQNVFFQFSYNLGLYFVNVYLWLNDNLNHHSNSFKYIATYYHVHNAISEYEIMFNDHNHKLKFLNDDYNKFLSENKFEEVLNNKNKILQCYLVDTEDNLIMECTEELRNFRYYLTNTNSSLTYRIFMDHIISLQPNPINYHKYNVLLYINDNNLSEINITLDNTNLDSCIQF